MIENPTPQNWQNLQKSVCRLFLEIGLNAEIGKVFKTPRGRVEIDVFAVDENSVDKIQYIVECKNWNRMIPQKEVHSFTTVINEIGANIGFLISQKGLQQGAKSYAQNTNITGLTFKEFQMRYFETWYKHFFVNKIGDSVDSLAQYVEPINSYRDKLVNKLPTTSQKKYRELYKRYQLFGTAVALFEFPRYSSMFNLSPPPPKDINQIIKAFLMASNGSIHLKSKYYRDILFEIISHVDQITELFNEIFGCDIFNKNLEERERKGAAPN